MAKPKWRPSIKLSTNMALITGLIMGVLAAIVQGFFDLQPPAGDGICGISHPANLVNWLTNNVFDPETRTAEYKACAVKVEKAIDGQASAD